MDTTFEQAKQFFLQGLRHYEAGRFAQAQAQFEASLALVPQRASTLTNLGATQIKLGKFADAAAVLDEAVRIDAGDAQAWGHLGTALAELGQHARALACCDEALHRNDKLAPAWTLKGTLLRDLQRDAEAVPCFRKAIDLGGDPQLNGFLLAGVGGGEAPRSAPRPYVQALFDGYAPGFDQHAVQVLQYRAPEILAQGLAARRFDAVLDLGCGTGLMAEQLKGRATRIVGVDLSHNMVEQARRRSAYAEVVQADGLDYLTSTTERFDLVVAADVFIYVGELDATFAAVRNVLGPDGVFAFTVELAEESDRVVLRPSLRFAHSRRYILSLAAEHGFEVMHTARHTIRHDQGKAITGLFAWLVPSRP
ncbi:MAG TPA: methyltransferase domain-containing protein [Ramlibacter sp.]|nr:methyltransferase domain-containing protein [Ramlibacter sp.]